MGTSPGRDDVVDLHTVLCGRPCLYFVGVVKCSGTVHPKDGQVPVEIA